MGGVPEFSPAPGTLSASRGYIVCQPRVHRVPAAGTSSAGRWYIECRPRVHRVPAAGTSSAGPWQSHCRPLAIALPALGNRIAGPWQSHCRPLAIALPGLGNRIAGPWQLHCRAVRPNGPYLPCGVGRRHGLATPVSVSFRRSVSRSMPSYFRPFARFQVSLMPMTLDVSRFRVTSCL